MPQEQNWYTEQSVIDAPPALCLFADWLEEGCSVNSSGSSTPPKDRARVLGLE